MSAMYLAPYTSPYAPFIELSQTQDTWPADPLCIQPILGWYFPQVSWEYFFTWFWVMTAVAKTTDAFLLPLVVLRRLPVRMEWKYKVLQLRALILDFWRSLRRWRVLREISMSRFLCASISQGLQTPIQLVYQPIQNIVPPTILIYKHELGRQPPLWKKVWGYRITELFGLEHLRIILSHTSVQTATYRILPKPHKN